MCRLLLSLLSSILTTFAIHALVDIPSLTIRKYNLTDYKAASQNWDLAVSPGGILYVANNSGLLTFDGSNWNLYELSDKSPILRVELSGDTVYCLSTTSRGFWLPNKTEGMVFHPLEQTPEHITFRDMNPLYTENLPFSLPDEILQHRPNAFASINNFNFTGTQGQGIYITDPEGNILLHLTSKQGLQDNIVNGFYVHNLRTLWIVFDNGLARMTLNSSLEFLAYRHEVGKLIDATLHDNTLYIRTVTNYYKQNLGILDTFVPVPEEEALSVFARKKDARTFKVEDIIKSPKSHKGVDKKAKVYQVSDTIYWFVSSNETKLFYINGDNVRLINRIRLDNYNAHIVYQGKQIIPLNDSLHIVSTIEGVFLFNLNSLALHAKDRGLPFRFTKIEYEDPEGIHRVYPDEDKLSLPHNYSEMVLHVGSSVFNFNNQISYKIDDVSPDWSDWQKEGEISFLKLPKGDYTIRVRKYVFNGDFPEISFAFEVLPPWYESIWAFFAYFILFFIALHLIISNYVKSQWKKEQLRLELERRAEQQKIQQMQNEILEKELQNKKNELMKQTSVLASKGIAVNKLLDELDEQRRTLGERYPNKLYQRMRALMEDIMNDQNDWQAFEAYFNSAHQNFIDRFRQQYEDITTGDLRLSCLLRMNLSTKEIASLLNISIRAVELRRYRLRKRIGLASDKNLTDFLINF